MHGTDYEPLQYDPLAHTLTNTNMTLYPQSEQEFTQLKKQFGRVSRLDRLVLQIFRGKNDILEYSCRLADEDAHTLQGKERCAVREIGVYWYLFSNLVVWCRRATLTKANFE